MKRESKLIFISISLVLILSLSFVSAGWFSDLFKKKEITGQVIENQQPTEFATFGHYSSFTDIEKNVKGLFIKYLVRSLASAIDRQEIVVLSKKTGKPLNRP